MSAIKTVTEKTTRLYSIRIDAYVDGGTGLTTDAQAAWAKDTVQRLIWMRFRHRVRAAFDGDRTVILELAPTFGWSGGAPITVAKSAAEYEAAMAEVCDAEYAIRDTLREAFGTKAAYLTVRRFHGEVPDGLAWKKL